MPATDVPMEATGEHSSLGQTLRPLQPLLATQGLTELCINRPCEAFAETAEGWRQWQLPFADFGWCYRFARLVAHATRQRVDAFSPLLSASLPGGERVQFVLPPATSEGCVSITLRRPAQQPWTLESLEASGALQQVRLTGDGTAQQPCGALRDLLSQRRIGAFLRAAVRQRCNIVVSGPTGSGKTTWTKALLREIPPDERIVTIEDARELTLDRHPNHVRLFYSKDLQGEANVSPRQLLECSLRMKPDRVLLAELRGEEAFYFLRNVNSGHPGSITSVHAGSADGAFEQLMLLVKESAPGRQLAREDIHALLRRSVDIILQVGFSAHRRVIREIYLAEAPGAQLRGD